MKNLVKFLTIALMSQSAFATSIAGRYVFYNNSAYDGRDKAPNIQDDMAIATDKRALLPSRVASFINITSYTKGINGIMIDLEGTPDYLTLADFDFYTGTSNTPNFWPKAPSPIGFLLRKGEGLNGSDRYTVVFEDYSIINKYLAVVVKANAHTGFGQPHAFYFGNRIGDTGLGNNADYAITNSTDETETRNNVAAANSISNVFDFNRDKLVTAADANATRSAPGSLKYFLAPLMSFKYYTVSVGTQHSCALDDSGVKCWGDNRYGQINSPSFINPRQLQSGSSHNCALDDVGVKCWGDNRYGQTNVPFLVNPKQIVAGGNHSCALDDSGVKCWGFNFSGQINVPTLINPKQVSAGSSHTCAIHDLGVKCWGDNYNAQLNVPTLVNPKFVSAGGTQTCAIDDLGAKCWGASHSTNAEAGIPILYSPKFISADPGITCVIDDAGLTCVGNRLDHQLEIPYELYAPMYVSSGPRHTCAVGSSEIVCWGNNGYGQTNIPTLSFTDLSLPH